MEQDITYQTLIIGFKMASLVTTAVTKAAVEHSDLTMDASPKEPSVELEPEDSLAEPELRLLERSTEDASGNSAIATEISQLVPAVDACDVPLPDQDCDEDLLEVSSLPIITCQSGY